MTTEAQLVEERTKYIFGLFKKSSGASFSGVLALIAFVTAFAGYGRIIPLPAPFVFVVLGVAAGISAALFAWKKERFAFYPLLAWIVYLATYIRTRNLPGLRDVTTGQWTLGPDLDPFLFLRWAKDIVQHGSLPAIDVMRYVPLGFDTNSETLLLPYLIAWFHNIASVIGLTGSVEHSAVLFPVFMFGLTIVAFFFFVKEVFAGQGKNKSSMTALIASLFLSIIPILLPRTIAGIPEKESAAFFFMFAALYFFFVSWKKNNLYPKIAFAALAGVASALMALVWGGYIYLFVLIGFTTLAAFLAGMTNERHTYAYAAWFIITSGIMLVSSSRYNLQDILSSTTTGLAFGVLVILIIDAIYSQLIKTGKIKQLWTDKLPRQIISTVAAIIIGIVLGSIILGPSFIGESLSDVKNTLIKPVQDRIGVTVAENKQPYLTEWISNFGPHLSEISSMLGISNVQSSSFGRIPLFFLLFVTGAVYLFSRGTRVLQRKHRIYLVASYALLIIAVLFSRTSQNSTLNGVNFVSVALYAGGILLFFLVSTYVYYKDFKMRGLESVKSLPLPVMFIAIFFLVMLVSARGAIRLVMMLVPVTAMIAGAFISEVSGRYLQRRRENQRAFFSAAVAIVMIVLIGLSALYFYNASSASAQGYVPSSYTQQWQYAMGWVRENTPANAVFAHWWDYGYWVQTMGERATIVDGGNLIGYWNYLVGRHALTGPSEREALNFLYSHNVTHFLIDSSDIGKYPAFSSIGSDRLYDRRSWIDTFLRNDQGTYEGKNSTFYIYQGQSILDADVSYQSNGSRIFLPGINDIALSDISNVAGVGALMVEVRGDGILNGAEAIVVYQGRQYRVPLRYAFFKGRFYDFGTGIDAGLFIFPSIQLVQDGQQAIADDKGAAMFLSSKTVHSQFAKLYLYEEPQAGFKLVHSEDGFFVKALKERGAQIDDFVFYQGVQGPIKIWGVNYPEDMAVNQTYLQRSFPEGQLWAA